MFKIFIRAVAVLVATGIVTFLLLLSIEIVIFFKLRSNFDRDRSLGYLPVVGARLDQLRRRQSRPLPPRGEDGGDHGEQLEQPERDPVETTSATATNLTNHKDRSASGIPHFATIRS